MGAVLLFPQSTSIGLMDTIIFCAQHSQVQLMNRRKKQNQENSQN